MGKCVNTVNIITHNMGRRERFTASSLQHPKHAVFSPVNINYQSDVVTQKAAHHHLTDYKHLFCKAVTMIKD